VGVGDGQAGRALGGESARRDLHCSAARTRRRTRSTARTYKPSDTFPNRKAEPLRKLLIPVVLVLAAGALAVFASSAPSATRVKVGDNYFVRASGVPTISVAKGTRVKWVWRGRSLHNVKVVRGPVKFGSTSMTSGTYVKRVRRAGTYTIICTVHGGSDQKMRLVVK
jgi:plastocyanin